MFERFTAQSRRAIVLAQEEARLLSHNYIGTEHLLLGLLADPESGAARALESLNITLEAVREQVREIIGEGAEQQSGHIPFTPRAKRVLELSLREALTLRSQSIGSEHLLLGIVAEGEGVAALILDRLGASHAAIKERVAEMAGQESDPAPSPLEMSGQLRTAARLRMEGLGTVQATLAKIERRLARIEAHLGIADDQEAGDGGDDSGGGGDSGGGDSGGGEPEPAEEPRAGE
jgi:ATP-dependent Clp protease ATP-binding subunit ClpC